MRQTLNLPFAFFNENFGITAAYVYGVLGFPQKQSALLTTVMVGSKGSWNPFENWPWVQKFLGIQWLQFVPFVEFGRVASEWEIERLHSDMKWDAGLGIRALAKGVVVRIDTAVSDEEIGVQMMISQRFQF